MAGIPSAVVLNLSMALSTVLASGIVNGPSNPILFWLGLTTAVLLARYAGLLLVKRTKAADLAPQFALRILTLGAFGSGLAWSVLPYFLPDISISNFNGSGKDMYVLFVLAGIAAGAIPKAMAYSTAGLAFAIPPVLSTITLLLAAGGVGSAILIVNAIAFFVLLYGSSRAGEKIFVSSELRKLKSDQLAHSLQQANADIRKTNSRLEVLANCDPLTGLSNRILFNNRLKSDLAMAAESGHELALLIIDLDRFKSINDTLGHSAGDAVLIEISHYLRFIIGSKGMIARLGGDEFAVTFLGQQATRTARIASRDILKKSGKPITVDGDAFVIGASIGLAVYPQHAATAEELLACADMALYEAKEKGRRRLREFNPQLKARADRQRQIELDLEDAILSGAVEAWFQPQVMLNSRCIAGFEALVRWTHPRLGPISPPEIIQAAQAMHLADRLTAHMASAACNLLLRLPDAGLPDATVAINVSPREFSFYSLADVLGLVVKTHGVNPALLEIEITEEAIIDTTIVGGELKRLEEAGYKLAVDDFGMGHSSLAYLISLKIDRLKIDRSFVEGVASSRHNQALIAALIGIGHTLSIDIIVEGVEHEEDAKVLGVLGCRIGQGYLYARPMPIENLVPWIEQHTQCGRKPLT